MSSVEHGSKFPLQSIENKITDNIHVQNEKVVSKQNFPARKPIYEIACHNLISESDEFPQTDKEESILNKKLVEAINNINLKIEKINNLKRNEAYAKKVNMLMIFYCFLILHLFYNK